jgi:hypothetical protein
MSGETTFAQIAEWMAGEVESKDYLDQQTAAYEILMRFGAQFTYTNTNGNLAISKDVLQAFNELTAETVVWERGSRTWRKRMDYDKSGREQS